MSVRPPGNSPGRPVAISRRGRAVAISVVVLILLIQVLPRLNSAYTDWLWFGSVDATSVFRTELLMRLGLFVVVALLIGLSVSAGILLAGRVRCHRLQRSARPDIAGGAGVRAADGWTSDHAGLRWTGLALDCLISLGGCTSWTS